MFVNIVIAPFFIVTAFFRKRGRNSSSNGSCRSNKCPYT